MKGDNMDYQLQKTEIPFWKKYALTIKEASVYFEIGETKLRRILNENYDAPYVLHNGRRTLVKRTAFEQYLDQNDSI